MFPREDLTGNNLAATLKVVGSGEIRCRMRPGPALETQTKALHLTRATEFAWQEPHRHLLQREDYMVAVGWIGAVAWNQKTGEVRNRLGGTFSRLWFDPGWYHNIYTSPGAEFVTIQIAALGVDVEKDRYLIDTPAEVEEVMQSVATEIRRLCSGDT